VWTQSSMTAILDYLLCLVVCFGRHNDNSSGTQLVPLCLTQAYHLLPPPLLLPTSPLYVVLVIFCAISKKESENQQIQLAGTYMIVYCLTRNFIKLSNRTHTKNHPRSLDLLENPLWLSFILYRGKPWRWEVLGNLAND